MSAHVVPPARHPPRQSCNDPHGKISCHHVGAVT